LSTESYVRLNHYCFDLLKKKNSDKKKNLNNL